MLSIGVCPSCETGPLGLRRCGVCRRIVALCDECDAAWRDGGRGRATFAEGEAMPCPWCRASLWTGGARWATRAEAEATAWVEADGRGLVEGDPFEPRAG